MVGAVGQLLTMAAVAALSASTVQDVGASSVDYGFTLEESLPVGQSLDSESQSSYDPWELRSDWRSTRSLNDVGSLPSCYASSTSRSSWESRPIMPSTSWFGGIHGGCSYAQNSVELRPESHWHEGESRPAGFNSLSGERACEDEVPAVPDFEHLPPRVRRPGT